MKPLRFAAVDKPDGALLVWPSGGVPGTVYFRTPDGACVSRTDVRRLHTALGRWLAVKPKKAKR